MALKYLANGHGFILPLSNTLRHRIHLGPSVVFRSGCTYTYQKVIFFVVDFLSV